MSEMKTMYHNLGDAAKAVLIEKCMVVLSIIKKNDFKSITKL